MIRSILLLVFFCAVIAFVGYAIFVKLKDQPTNQSQARRVVGALWAAGLAAAGWVATFFTTPPPSIP